MSVTVSRDSGYRPSGRLRHGVFSTNAAGSFKLNALGLGRFEIETVVATDTFGRTSTRTQTVDVIDDDVIAPTITFSGPSNAVNPQLDSVTQAISWSVADDSGVGTVFVELLRNGISVFTSGASGTVNFDSFGIGNFVLEVTATDGDNDWAGDGATTTSASFTGIFNDDTVGPNITFGGPSAVARRNSG